MKYILAAVVSFYQKTLSPDHGFFKSYFSYGFCRFHPTCSEYARQAIIKHGAIKGSYLAGKRILRCNPMVQPAIDNIPE